MFFKDTLFLASGGLHNLNEERCKAIEGPTIYLFPDLGAEENGCINTRPKLTAPKV